MQKSCLLITIALLVCCLYACRKGDNKPSQLMLIGKWNLQQQKAVRYLDGVKNKDTLYTATANNRADLQFNTDNTYSSNAYFTAGVGLGAYATYTTDGGTYAYSAALFSISNGVTGFGNVGLTFIAGPPPVIHQVSHSEQVNQLTASILNMHTESVVTATTPGGTQTFRYVNDYIYTK